MTRNFHSRFQAKDVLVVGLGVSGLWTSRWLLQQGVDVTVSEMKAEDYLDPTLCAELRTIGAKLEVGGHEASTFLNTELIIISPGVPHDMDLLMMAKEKGIAVLGELEFASRFIDSPIIAVTGTNGKSTVTTFLGEMFLLSGTSVFVGGNIGTPLMAYVAQNQDVEFVIAEVSSFQLDTIDMFSPYVSIILNISPDHLDRYPGYDKYAQTKLNLIKNQGPGQYAILNDNDEILTSLDTKRGVCTLKYGIEKKNGRQAMVENGSIILNIDGENIQTYSYANFKLPGTHNLENLMACILAGTIVTIEPRIIQQTINTFKGLPNRFEKVAEINGILFINDSKATNVDAAIKSVKSLDKPVILIAGGRHKGESYMTLAQAAKQKVKIAVLIGEAKDILASAFEGFVPYISVETLDEAVKESYSIAEKGDAVLLAPACASFDMFSDYAHRGRAFKSAIGTLLHD